VGDDLHSRLDGGRETKVNKTILKMSPYSFPLERTREKTRGGKTTGRHFKRKVRKKKGIGLLIRGKNRHNEKSARGAPKMRLGRKREFRFLKKKRCTQENCIQ